MMFSYPFAFIGLWVFAFVLAAVTALLEIQIEGANGWAKDLPTWRYAPKWVLTFMNGKDFTGYHLYLNLHMLVFFHLPVLFLGWSAYIEFTILSISCACLLVEDFLWFVLNQHFGWQSFMKTKVSWYKQWIGPFPIDYYFWLFVSGFLAYLRGLCSGASPDPSLSQFTLPVQHLIGWFVGFLICVVLIFMTSAVMTRRIARFLAQDTLPHPGHPHA